MVEYKYQQPETKNERQFQIFLRVIKEPHWYEQPTRMIKGLPVGALTWTSRTRFEVINGIHVITPDTKALIIENNQFRSNFDPSCFEIIHTSKQKIKR